MPPVTPPTEVTDFYVSPACTKAVISHSAHAGRGYEAYLGMGYDLTAPFLSDKAVRARVIDLDKLDDDRKLHIASTSATSQVFKGDDAEDYLKSIMTSGEFENPAGQKATPLFAGSINSPGTNDTHYTIISQWGLGRYYFNAMRPTLLKVLSDEFVSDLSTLSADEIVSRYGTHVVKNATMGYMMRHDYHAYISIPESYYKTDAAYDAMTRILGTSDPDALAVSLYGLGNFGADLDVSIHGGKPDSNYFDNNWPWAESPTQQWLNGLKDEDAVMINLRGDDLVPLTQMIADDKKRAQVEYAVSRYISNSAKSLKSTVALFQNTNGKVYRYSVTEEEARRLESENGLRCYGVLGSLYSNQVAGTVALVSTLSSDGNTQKLTAVEPGNGVVSGILGYALSAPADGCVTLYEITDGHGRYAYTIELLESYGSKNKWHRTGEQFYLLRP